jgi:hypothetical protein
MKTAAETNSYVEKLFAAANSNDSTLYQQALAGNVNINQRNSAQQCALACAIHSKSHLILSALLEALADTEIRDKKLRTPLHIAVINGDITAIKLLLHHQARIDAHDIDQNTPIMLANLHHDPVIKEEMIRLLQASLFTAAEEKQLELGINLKSLLVDVDVISEAQHKLRLWLPSIRDRALQSELEALEPTLLQPDQLTLKSASVLQDNSLRPTFKKISTVLKRSSTSGDSEQEKQNKSLSVRAIDDLLIRIQTFRDNIHINSDEILGKVYNEVVRLINAYNTIKRKMLSMDPQNSDEFVTPRIQIKSQFGFHYLDPNAATRFTNHFEGNKTDFSAPGRDNQHGIHSVVKIRDNFYKVRQQTRLWNELSISFIFILPVVVPRQQCWLI